MDIKEKLGAAAGRVRFLLTGKKLSSSHINKFKGFIVDKCKCLLASVLSKTGDICSKRIASLEVYKSRKTAI